MACITYGATLRIACRRGSITLGGKAGIDYTGGTIQPEVYSVADCLQAGIDYTPDLLKIHLLRLRIACRRGSITLQFRQGTV